MKVKRLEIFGFKSFKDSFVLNFDSDLIGIVGPNGCGKSNIIDALRWVLGESHARQLRGNVQEDLIFNGSETCKAMGMAEVSVTFETTPGWVPAIGEEIDPAEIKLIHSLEGLADEGGAVVGEDESGDSLASGLEVARRTEEEVRAAFFQVPGIFEASEIQITRRLYRSGESEYFINKVACRLKDIVDLCRTIGLGARGLNIVQQGTIGEIITRKPTERRELLEEAAGISGFRSRLETALRQLARTQDNIARLRDIYEEVGKQVRSLKRQAARAKARAEQKEQLRVLDHKVYSTRVHNLRTRKVAAEQRIAELGTEQGGIQSLVEACQIDYQNALSEDARLDSSYSKLREERQGIRRELDALREEEHALKVELAKLETRLRATENGYVQIEERKQALALDLERRLQLISSLDVKIAETQGRKTHAEQELSRIQQQTMFAGNSNESLASAQFAGEITELNQRVDRLGGLTQEITDLSGAIDALRKGLRIERDKANEERVTLAALEAEVKSLKSQLQALSEHVVRAVADGSENVGDVLLAGMHVPQSLQRAVAAVTADRAQFLVSHDAWTLFHNYKDRASQPSKNPSGQSKATRVGLIDAAVRGELTPLGDEERRVAPSVRHLVQAFDVRPDYEGPVSMMLGHVLLVDSLMEAQNLRELFSRSPAMSSSSEETNSLSDNSAIWHGQVIVTLDGEVVCPWGWYTTSGDGAGFSLALRLREQQEKIEGLKVLFESSFAAVNQKDRELTLLEKDHRAKEDEKKSLIQDQRRLSQLLQFVRDAERRERNEALDKERLAQKQVRDIGEELTGFQSRIENEKRRVGELEAERDDLSRRRERLAEGERQLKVEHATLANKIAAARQDQEGAQTLAQLQAQMAEKEQLITELENGRRLSRETLAAKTKEVESLRASLDRMGQEANSLRLDVERGDVETQMLSEEFKRFYGEENEIPEAVELTTDELAKGTQVMLKDWQEQSGRIRRMLEKEGEVDPEVVARYEEEQKRHDMLTVQLKDLELGAATLDKTTKYLKEISRIRFIKTFQFVSQKFSELVPRLFGGGMAKMELVNPEDPLSSGVELTVRPPGKALKSLELLSGGEKALAAIAILVSMFLHRPGPICVMDEVDAPLDDANLGKFMELVREISSTTQFLVITHNKQTMAIVDRLIGITMQEKGVSTAMEVSFAEAEAELERWEGVANA